MDAGPQNSEPPDKVRDRVSRGTRWTSYPGGEVGYSISRGRIWTGNPDGQVGGGPADQQTEQQINVA